MNFVKYFRELLKTLKSIEAHLELLSGCVDKSNHRGKSCITAGHWNDHK